MFSLISLILLFFNILATVLILVMAGLVIAVLLALFLLIAIVVGMKEKSIFKGLKIFLIASSVLTISPAIAYFSAYKIDNILHLSSNQLFFLGGGIGVIISVIFGLFTFNLFERLARKIYKSIREKSFAK